MTSQAGISCKIDGLYMRATSFWKYENISLESRPGFVKSQAVTAETEEKDSHLSC